MNTYNGSRLPLYVSAAALIAMIVTSTIITNMYLQVQTRIVDLQSRVESLQSQLQSLSREGENGSEAHQVFLLIQESVVQVLNKKVGVKGLEPYASGSGFVYNKEGHIITNNHVVDKADVIEVTFLDGSTFRATLIGADPYSDLAVLKVDIAPDRLKPVILGDSSKLLVGETIYAVGAPFGLSWSLTKGIVSQIGRTLPSAGGYPIVGVIQVDAAINPGNSGGPLLNSVGMVVGVNTAIQTETGVFSGVGFAIPSNLVKRVSSSLISTGHYDHPWLGVIGTDVTPSIAEIMNLKEAKGVLVISTVKDSPAEKAGVRGGERTEIIEGRNVTIGGDVIIGVNEQPVRKFEDLSFFLEYNCRPGEKIHLNIIRNGTLIVLEVNLGVRPPPSR
ncbi:MAG: trypsin-like peptidase domain-containing protein [Candidatus Bathyarchaeia archaeon]